MRVFFSAGEVSGDAAGAGLARAILRRQPDAALFGIGGHRMRDAGVAVTAETNHLGTVGIGEAASVVPAFWRLFRHAQRQLRGTPPSAAVLIGNDVFNVLLGRWLRARGVPTAGYFPPQVWVWRSLARSISRSYDVIFTSFPEEQAVYERAGGSGASVTFVGHYLADQLGPSTPAEVGAAKRSLGLEPDEELVGLFPGSRRHELTLLAPILLGAARELAERNPGLRFAAAAAEPEYRSIIEAEVDRRLMADRVVVCDNGLDVLRASDVAVAASGTVTLEASLLGVPAVSVYKVTPITELVARALIRAGALVGDTVSLPNLILGDNVLPELTQRAANARTIADAVQYLQREPQRQAIRRQLREISALVTGPASFERTADAVIELARQRRVPSSSRVAAEPVSRAGTGPA